MKQEVKLVGWYGIGDAEVSVTVEFSRTGARLLASLNMRQYTPSSGNVTADVFDSLFVASDELTWDKMEGYGGGDADDCVRHAAIRLAGDVVKQAVHLKPAGVPYCDGEG